MKPIKQTIVVRKDLKMPKGKIAAQAAHAALAAVFPLHGKSMFVRLLAFVWQLATDKQLRVWLSGSFKKIALWADSEDEMMAILQRAKIDGLRTSLITDNGETVFNGVLTRTCIAIGPNYAEDIDLITGRLKPLQ